MYGGQGGRLTAGALPGSAAMVGRAWQQRWNARKPLQLCVGILTARDTRDTVVPARPGRTRRRSCRDHGPGTSTSGVTPDPAEQRLAPVAAEAPTRDLPLADLASVSAPASVNGAKAARAAPVEVATAHPSTAAATLTRRRRVVR